MATKIWPERHRSVSEFLTAQNHALLCRFYIIELLILYQNRASDP